MSWDSVDTALKRLRAHAAPAWTDYYGFYSSWLGGYFNEPWAMSVPMDDHGFHRGDGVFEAIRIHARALIDFDAHVERLYRSAGLIGITPPADVADTCKELARRCDAEAGVLRLYVTRGPGGFSPLPSESVGAQVYAAITRLKTPSAEAYARGIRATVSSLHAKDPFFARIKSLNYLQNVLVKRECAERGAELAVCLSEDGVVTEGATENIMIVTPERRVLVPRFDYTLAGTTVRTVMDIARDMPDVSGVDFADLTLADLHAAGEIAFVGTTLGVLPVGRLDDHELEPGPVCRALQAAYVGRMTNDPNLRTPF